MITVPVPSPTSPLVSATLREDDTLLRSVLDRPKANILTSRDGNEGISAYLERRKPVWEDR